jgi:PAS domain S-box-containing protein
VRQNVPGSTFAASPSCILVIDNAPEDVRQIRAALAALPRADLTIEQIGQLSGGLALLAERAFDIILLALTLPDNTDLEGLRQIRARVPQTPVIVLADTEDETMVLRALQAGAQEYLTTRQLDPATLRRTLESAQVRQQASQTIAGSEQYLAGILATASEAIVSIDANQKIVLFNKAAEEIFGYSAEEVLGQSLDLLLPQRFVVPHRGHVNAFAKEPTYERRMAHRSQIFGRRKDGTEFPLTAGISKFNRNGQLIYTAIVEDLSERRRADAARALLASIVETSDQAILAKDLNGIILSWNRGAELLYGYAPGEAIGKHIGLIVPPEREGEITEIINAIKRGERVEHYETVRVKKNGERLEVLLTISPILGFNGEIVGASSIANDITLRKRYEEQLQRQLSHIRALSEIDRAITASFDVRVTLNVFLDQVTTQLGVDAAAVLLMNPFALTLEYAASRGFLTDEIMRTQLRVGEGYAGRVALERKMINIPELAHIPDLAGRLHTFQLEGFRSYCGVPLIAKGQCKGVLEVLSRKPLTTDAEWLNFLQTLAGQAAIAIDSASLFNELQKSNIDLMRAYDTTLEGWSHALDLRDHETEGHTQRVTEKTMQLVRAMGMNDAELVHVRRGALLHDIGKMGIPDSILLKPDALTHEEWKIMRQHPVYAFQMLAPIHYLKPALDIPYCHHERWDGSGYPRGLKGEQIPLAARTFAVVDAWDALRSNRPYRTAWTAEQVLDYLRAEAGKQFDPNIVSIFEAMRLDAPL